MPERVFGECGVIMGKQYQISLSEKQTIVIKDALEEYFRIRMNQWSDLADSLSSKNIDLSPDNPNHEKIFERYLSDRDAVKEVFECAGRILWRYSQLNPKTEEQLIAEDIWQVIRHELWKSSDVKGNWCVDSREPLRMSDEPLPEMKVNV